MRIEFQSRLLYKSVDICVVVATVVEVDVALVDVAAVDLLDTVVTLI